MMNKKCGKARWALVYPKVNLNNWIEGKTVESITYNPDILFTVNLSLLQAMTTVDWRNVKVMIVFMSNKFKKKKTMKWNWKTTAKQKKILKNDWKEFFFVHFLALKLDWTNRKSNCQMSKKFCLVCVRFTFSLIFLFGSSQHFTMSPEQIWLCHLYGVRFSFVVFIIFLVWLKLSTSNTYRPLGCCVCQWGEETHTTTRSLSKKNAK